VLAHSPARNSGRRPLFQVRKRATFFWARVSACLGERRYVELAVMSQLDLVSVHQNLDADPASKTPLIIDLICCRMSKISVNSPSLQVTKTYTKSYDCRAINYGYQCPSAFISFLCQKLKGMNS